MSRVSGQKACFFEMEQVLKSDNCFSAALKNMYKLLKVESSYSIN